MNISLLKQIAEYQNKIIDKLYQKQMQENNTAYKETKDKLFYELDFEFITQMAERMQSNKGKYKPYNWQKLDNIADLQQALFRHVIEVMNGNYKDDYREFGHLETIAINAMFINYQLQNKEKNNFKGLLSDFKEQEFNPVEKVKYNIGDKWINDNSKNYIGYYDINKIIYISISKNEKAKVITMCKKIFENKIKSGEIKLIK